MGFFKNLMNKFKYAPEMDTVRKMVESYHGNRQQLGLDHDMALWYSHGPYFSKIIWDVWRWDQVCQSMGISGSEFENFLKKKMTQFRAFLEYNGVYNDVFMAGSAIIGIDIWKKNSDKPYLTGDALYDELMKGFSAEKYKKVERNVKGGYERLKREDILRNMRCWECEYFDSDNTNCKAKMKPCGRG